MYALKFIQKEPCNDKSDHLFTYTYKFYSPDTRLHYVLRAEYHSGSVFAIKFYCKAHRRSDFKYNIIINRGHCLKILNTCLSLLPELLKKYPQASFALNSSRSVELGSSQKLTEDIKENQRYRIYKNFIQSRIGKHTFTHLYYPEISSYLLINNHYPDIDIKEQEILQMFQRTYRSLPDIV